MSKSIQSEIIESMETRIATKEQIDWMGLIEEIAGDNEHLMNYLPILKCIESINQPFELSVHFNTIKGQFASSESKMVNLLTEANFVSEIDFCIIESDSDSELFMNYNCLKLYIMDRADINMIKALILGEQIYSMYKGSPIEIKISTHPRTHIMIVEQSKYDSKSMDKTAKELGYPPAILAIYVGTKKNLLAKHEVIKKDDTHKYGNVIVPPTYSIYANGLTDAMRISRHLTETLGDPYKLNLRKSLAKGDKAPTKTEAWGFVFKSSMFGVNPEKKVPFTFDDIVKETKSIFIQMLAQQHVDTYELSDVEYYQCIDKWEAKRKERSGYFSALKTHSTRIEYIKLQTKKANRGKKTGRSTRATIPTPTVVPTTTNGYETDGSTHEQDVEEDVEEEEEEEEEEEDVEEE